MRALGGLGERELFEQFGALALRFCAAEAEQAPEDHEVLGALSRSSTDANCAVTPMSWRTTCASLITS